MKSAVAQRPTVTGEEPSETTPEEAFGLVADETRFRILQALWDATTGGDRAVSFSGLRERADVEDSGRFNYHLDQLTPRFVRRNGDGYELTYAGQQVVGAAVSGVYTEADSHSVDPIPVGDCPDCEGRLEASYETGVITVDCADCDTVVARPTAPPVLAASHDDERLPAVFSRRTLATIREMNAGFCHLCGGRVTRALDAAVADIEGNEPVAITYTCEACGRAVTAGVGAVLLTHPAVVAFLHDNGVDLGETPLWELLWAIDPPIRVVCEEPLELEVTVPADGEAFVATLDESLAVQSYSRSDREG